MALPTDLLAHLDQTLRSKTGTSQTIIRAVPVRGGDINQAFRLLTRTNSYFVKLNRADLYPDMFSAESRGLQALGIATPEVIAFGVFGINSYLLTEWLEPLGKSVKGQENLGTMLAGIHRKTNKNFGLSYDNYIGSLGQSNTEETSWTQFYINQRLEPQILLASKNGCIDPGTRQKFQKLFLKLDTFFEPEAPSLLHGDLWSGNYIISTNHQPFLVDPAIYFGHREMDLAMTRLFGGFAGNFYNVYNEEFPLLPDWEKRISLWQLYPLLVHVNLFGKSYLSNIQNCLKYWI